MKSTVPRTDAPLLGAIICTAAAGVGLAVGAGVAVLAELSTMTAAVATPTVPEPLYPLQTKVCVPSSTLVDDQAYENVNPLPLEYEGEVAR